MNSLGRYLLLGAVAWRLVAGASGAGAAEERDFVLAAPGVKSVIVIADGWRQHAWYDWGGHAILGRYAKQVTGIDLAVMEAGKLSAPGARERYDYRIWVGRQPEVDRVIGERLDRLDDGGFSPCNAQSLGHGAGWR